VSKHSIDIGELVGLKGEEQLSKIGFEKKILSMGYQACGTLELWNYPSFFRDLIPQNLDRTNRSDRIDLAALEGMKFGPNLYHISRGS
jgi:alpha-dioxygenase